MDGGGFSSLTSFSGSATSYVDTTTSANHSYSYKVSVTNASGTATSLASTTTYNTPAAPTKLTAARSSATAVAISITNPAITATALELQRSTDASTWTTVSTITGSAVTSATDTPGGGTFYYRARNTRGTLQSAWSAASAAVVTVIAPAAPTLTAPATGTVFSTATTSITFAWTHNPKDGSAQTAAQVRYSTDAGTSWTTTDVATASTLTIDNTFADGTTLTWQARTKGAAADYGAWSATRTFSVYQQPSVEITTPDTDGWELTDMPLAVALSYSDGTSAALADATLAISREGVTLFTLDMGTSTTAEITADEWLPENGLSYVMSISTRSTSTLQASTSITVTADFASPDAATLSITNSPDTGDVQLQPTIDEGTGATRAISISIYRVSSAGRVLIASGMDDGAIVTDQFAPLNTAYTYECVTFSEAGAAGTTTWANTIITNRYFFIWRGGMVYAYRNPKGSVSLSRPQKVRVHYVGKAYPTSYDSSAVDESRSTTFLLDSEDEARKFTQLVEDGGRCVYKSADGDVIHADVEITLDPRWRMRGRYGEIQVSMNRIEGVY